MKTPLEGFEPMWMVQKSLSRRPLKKVGHQTTKCSKFGIKKERKLPPTSQKWVTPLFGILYKKNNNHQQQNPNCFGCKLKKKFRNSPHLAHNVKIPKVKSKII
ncbi:hypothetical protein AMECASPLE_014915 [Ameca splendens]|uniref:Uncharacterized protein n=1 Tax=Ameca splendens TaxID=208324 RepID=A0ABV0ZXJ0_9TELE